MEKQASIAQALCLDCLKGSADGRSDYNKVVMLCLSGVIERNNWREVLNNLNRCSNFRKKASHRRFEMFDLRSMISSLSQIEHLKLNISSG
jgi:hypothetical protein